MTKRVLEFCRRFGQSYVRQRATIAHRWVKTADERSLLAVVWFALPWLSDHQDGDSNNGDPELAATAFCGLSTKASRLRCIHILQASSFPLAKVFRNSKQVLATLAFVALSLCTQAQEGGPSTAESDYSGQLPDAPALSADLPLTVFPHPENAPYFIAGQANIVFQAHGPFHSPYEGPNSLLSRGEYKTSLVGTLFLGLQLHHNLRYNTDAIFDVESAGGRGISEALGLAGFTNLDVVRNPNLGSAPYIARVLLHQTIGFTDKLVEVGRTPFSLATQAPERRLELHVGKMSLPDYFDLNSIGTDSHLQYLNWTVDNDGAWDYAADTRGYTYAAVAEYVDKTWTARYAVALMPTEANGINLDWNLRRASGQNMEFEWRHSLLGNLVKPERRGFVRVLSYVNHAHMGLYREAVQLYLSGVGERPDITSVAKFGAVKYGFGLNAEQELTENIRAFLRIGWNEDQHESFAYTECGQTVLFGGDYAGRLWSRPNDRLGIAFVSNAIKRDHQNYLAYGGLGFLLGDGKLSYGRENILESYYTLHAWRGVFYALDMQYITDPGYNRARGPVLVETVRMHVDF